MTWSHTIDGPGIYVLRRGNAEVGLLSFADDINHQPALVRAVVDALNEQEEDA